MEAKREFVRYTDYKELEETNKKLAEALLTAADKITTLQEEIKRLKAA